MASSLRSRLARLKERGEPEAGPRPLPKAGLPEAPPFLTAWERLSDYLYRRELALPLVLPPRFDPRPFLLRLGRDLSAPPPPPAEELPTSSLRFFDFETTGLSGGAGNLAFLGALGRVEGAELRIEQFFLADYPGEGDFVRAFSEALGPEPLLASYNGRSFDWPLFRSRCVMTGHRRREPFLHLDLLPTARRLWRSRLGSVSLGELETGLELNSRGEDLPGSEIPEVYRAYLEGRDEGRLELVMSHNAEDIAGLARFFGLALGLFADPLARAGDLGADERNLGRLLRRLGRGAEGETLLARAARAGDEAAALLLARLLRREGRYGEARAFLGLAARDFEGGMEAARLAEGEGRLEEALAAALAAAELAEGGAEEGRALARARRLSLRLAGASPGRPGRRRS